jgi:hypothetical protein
MDLFKRISALNQTLAIKAYANHIYPDDFDIDDLYDIYNESEIEELEDFDHIPMKKESKLLRRIMSETGLTEEEVRSRKKYKRMLAKEYNDSKKNPNSKCRTEKFYKWKLKYSGTSVSDVHRLKA